MSTNPGQLTALERDVDHALRCWRRSRSEPDGRREERPHGPTVTPSEDEIQGSRCLTSIGPGAVGYP